MYSCQLILTLKTLHNIHKGAEMVKGRVSHCFFFIAVVLSSLLVGQAFAFSVNVATSKDAITVSSPDAGVKTVALSVVDPNGNHVFSETITGKQARWVLSANSPDGIYKYEVTLSNVIAGSRARGQALNFVPEVSTHSGAIQVKSGEFVSTQIDEGENEGEEQSSLSDHVSAGIHSLAIKVVDFLVPAAHADQVIVDDLIVTGSKCVGQDCVNGENFGFDTLRLKENNLRLHFQDTSNSASFPSNDWRFIFNDSANGGSNFFSIEDSTAGRQLFTIDAGAPNNALYVDSLGRVGFGTSTPSLNLDISAGNTPSIRLNQNGSLGFATQTWDLGGNEQGFFIRDSIANSKPFQINAGAPDGSFSMLADGKLGLGISTPTETLHVIGNAIVSGNLELGSSRTIKNQIENLGVEQAMHAFQALEPVLFKYNHSPDKQSIGFIAEDVPDLVATQSRKSLKPMDIVAVLTKVVQEQQKAIEELSETVEALMAERD